MGRSPILPSPGHDRRRPGPENHDAGGPTVVTVPLKRSRRRPRARAGRIARAHAPSSPTPPRMASWHQEMPTTGRGRPVRRNVDKLRRVEVQPEP
jgi:hypothetical protein